MKVISILSFLLLFFLSACNDKPEILSGNNPLNVYPNPAIDMAYISFANPDKSTYRLTVVGTSGEIIFEKKENAADAQYSVNLSGERSGTYHVVLREGDSIFIRKLVKQ